MISLDRIKTVRSSKVDDIVKFLRMPQETYHIRRYDLNMSSKQNGCFPAITVLTTLLIALGSQQIVPELVNKVFKSPQKSVTQELEADGSSLSGIQQRVSPELTQEAITSEIEAIQSLRQGMNYLRARNILFAANWKPANRKSESKKEDLSVGIESASAKRFGIKLTEIEGCQPTGLGLCSGRLEHNPMDEPLRSQ